MKAKDDKKRYDRIFKAIMEDPEWKGWMNVIERNPFGHPKLNADHGTKHAMAVCQYGEKFLEQATRYESEDKRERLVGLFKIAALLHDIGMAEGSINDHAATSADMANWYLQQYDLSCYEIMEIANAIKVHSTDIHPTSRLNAALILGDKLDVAYERYANEACLDDRNIARMFREQRKVAHVSYDLMNPLFGDRATFSHYKVARLSYTLREEGDTALGNNTPYDATRLAEWPNCLVVPRNVAHHTLGCEEFQFVVNNVLVNINTII